MLDPSFADVAAEVGVEPELELVEAAPEEGRAGLALHSVGKPRITGPASFQVPVVLRDSQGRRVTVALSVRLDPAPDAEGP
jgi:hypothetical protein